MQIQQFAGGLHLRMAGQDLLDERAAGTRHAEDEDRHRRGIARAGQAIEQRGVEAVGNLSEVALTAWFVVLDFLAPQRIALK